MGSSSATSWTTHENRAGGRGSVTQSMRAGQNIEAGTVVRWGVEAGLGRFSSNATPRAERPRPR